LKHIHFDFQPYFEKLFNGPENKWGYGYHEINSWDIGCHEEPNEISCAVIKRDPTKAMGNGYYLFKKNTPLVINWMDRCHKILDHKLDLLKANPAQTPRDRMGEIRTVNGVRVQSTYPLRWA
jgi:hypothetical protein